jgi:hypothetical protein
MTAGRTKAVYRITNACRELIFGDLLTRDRATLDKMLGWKRPSRKPRGVWHSLDIEVINASSVLNVVDGQDIMGWAGKHKLSTLFLNELLILVSLSSYDAYEMAQSRLDWCCTPLRCIWSTRSQDRQGISSFDEVLDGRRSLGARLDHPWLYRYMCYPRKLCSSSMCTSTRLNLLEVMFSLSADENFHDIGEQSRIPYQEHYFKWVKMLRVGKAAEEDHIVDIFKFWDGIFFPAASRGGAGSDSDSDFENSMKLVRGEHDSRSPTENTASGSGTTQNNDDAADDGQEPREEGSADNNV